MGIVDTRVNWILRLLLLVSAAAVSVSGCGGSGGGSGSGGAGGSSPHALNLDFTRNTAPADGSFTAVVWISNPAGNVVSFTSPPTVTATRGSVSTPALRGDDYTGCRAHRRVSRHCHGNGLRQ